MPIVTDKYFVLWQILLFFSAGFNTCQILSYLFIFVTVYHADLYLHVGLAGSYSLHLSACLHVFQPVDHL